jgi:acyl-CoA thioesterase YciA
MQLPKEHAVLRIVPTARDVNAAGDIFGGWLMSQADIAGSIVAVRQTKGRVVTVAVNDFHFISPVFVGDVVSIYGEVEKSGKTSITVAMTIYSERKLSQNIEVIRVAKGYFTYVHLDNAGKPLPI